jgi:hypothetical protein
MLALADTQEGHRTLRCQKLIRHDGPYPLPSVRLYRRRRQQQSRSVRLVRSDLPELVSVPEGQGMGWYFRDISDDPSDQQDQFNNDEVALAEALVRETIQNSTDA